MVPSRSARKAFTLIELLVVIAIIAILAAILFPVFAQARDKARQTACLSNIKQQGLGLMMYVQDYDETWPRADYCLNNDATPFPLVPGGTATGCAGPKFGNRVNHYKWFYWTYPYTKSDQIYRCPSRQIVQTDPGYQDWQNSAELFNAYALNLSITGALNTYNKSATASGQYRNSWLGGTLAGLNRPADTMLIMELYFPGVGTVVQDSSAVTSNVYPLAQQGYWKNLLSPTNANYKNSAPHADGMNIAYADGHAKYLKAAQFIANCPTDAEYDGGTYPTTGYGTMATYPGKMPGYFSNANHKAYPMWGLE